MYQLAVSQAELPGSRTDPHYPQSPKVAFPFAAVTVRVTPRVY
jgi:hypothetical protein